MDGRTVASSGKGYKSRIQDEDLIIRPGAPLVRGKVVASLHFEGLNTEISGSDQDFF